MQTIVGDMQKSKHSLRKKILIAVVSTVVIAGAALLLTLWSNRFPEQNQETSYAGGLPQESIDSQRLAGLGKYDEANKILENAIISTTDDAKKYALYLQLGVNYENQKIYQRALDSYRRALGLLESSSAYESVARVEELMGDKETAIKDYRKAVELVDVNGDPMGNYEKRRLEDKIRLLGG